MFGVWLLFRGRTLVEIRAQNFHIDYSIGKQLLNCGFSFWIAQMAMRLIALIYNEQLGKYGEDVAISFYAIISSVMTFIIMPASGISQGIQPIVAFNLNKKVGFMWPTGIFYSTVKLTCDYKHYR